jgi:hypothetical protein
MYTYSSDGWNLGDLANYLVPLLSLQSYFVSVRVAYWAPEEHGLVADFEPGVIIAVRGSPLGELFHPGNLMSHTRGQNLAKDHYRRADTSSSDLPPTTKAPRSNSSKPPPPPPPKNNSPFFFTGLVS